MRRVMFVLLLALAIAPSAWAQSWPNEPSGSTTLGDCNFNSALCGISGASGSASIISDSSAPQSPSSVMEFRLPVGVSNGGGETWFPLNQQPREVFGGYWWKPSNPFEGHPNCSNKVHGLVLTNGNIWLDMHCSATGGPFVFKIILQPNSSENNCHLGNGYGDCPGTYALFGNQSSGNITLGAWHRVEVYFKSSSTSTSRDGILRMWVNGVQVMNYTTVNMSGSTIYWLFTPTWDGSWTPIHSTPFSHRYDQVHLSTGGNGNAPKGDTTPPARPTGLKAN